MQDLSKQYSSIKFTVGDAVAAARIRLHPAPICVNTVYHRSDDEIITLAELNQIADAIVDDTNCYK